MSFLQSLWGWVSLNLISPLKWDNIKSLFNGGVYWELTEEEHDKIRRLLKDGYYIILTRRKTHFTTYLISIGNFLKTGKWGYWSHALMNLEGDVSKDEDFRLMEATGPGTHYSSFMKVFDCDSVVLLRPKLFNVEDWVETLDKLKLQEGKPYDTLFDLVDDQKLSCIELVVEALEENIDKMPKFLQMMEEHKVVTPQMIYDCGDFEVVLEYRH